jgi:radical SAM protein with 4Fe4S-binding SPASM domain
MSGSQLNLVQAPTETEDRYLALLSGAAIRCHPVSVLWELTHRCNARCVHCYLVKPEGEAAREAGRQELGLDECVQVMDGLEELGTLFLTFTGGEILLRSDLFDIVGEARRRRFAVRLKTNGMLITPAVADRMAEHNVMSVDISLYGASAETHDRITTVRGSFERVVQAFRLLEERGVQTRATMPLMDANVAEQQMARELVESLGADLSLDPAITAMQDGCDVPLSYGLPDKAMIRYWTQVMVQPPETPDQRRYDGPICTAGRNRLCLGPYGDVFPCVELRISAGNIREASLQEIWRESDILERVRSLAWKDFRECFACELRDYCGPCMGQAWVEHGDLFRPCGEVCRQTQLRSQVIAVLEGVAQGSRPV